MRRHERFDTRIPIQFRQSEVQSQLSTNLLNISLGGVSFSLLDPITVGDEVMISINFIEPPFEVIGKIRWCRKFSDQYEVGLEFRNLKDPYLSRMFRQICEIEKYRTSQIKRHQREITSEQAAEEWIEKYAAEFE